MLDVPCRCTCSSSPCAVIASGETAFNQARKFRIDREHVFKGAVDRAGLPHDDTAVFLEDLRLDLSGIPVYQFRDVPGTFDDGGPDLLHAIGTQRIGFAWKNRVSAWIADNSSAAAGRRPCRLEWLTLGEPGIHALEDIPGDVGGPRKQRGPRKNSSGGPFEIPNQFRCSILYDVLTSG